MSESRYAELDDAKPSTPLPGDLMRQAIDMELGPKDRDFEHDR
jgi:hypothetical protein